MKNSSTTITLSDWVTSTTKIKVFFDQIVIDHDRSIGHVHKLSEDRVQRRYDDLKAAPPVVFGIFFGIFLSFLEFFEIFFLEFFWNFFGIFWGEL